MPFNVATGIGVFREVLLVVKKGAPTRKEYIGTRPPSPLDAPALHSFWRRQRFRKKCVSPKLVYIGIKKARPIRGIL